MDCVIFIFYLCKLLVISVDCGDGRSRTAVQTTHRAAFYMLSLPLVFDSCLPEGRPTGAYPLNLSGV